MKKYLLILPLLFLIGFTQINAQEVNVTFQVDMNVQIAKGNFDATTDTVTIPGGFNNWLNEPPANTEKIMDDSDADGIYTKTIAMAPSATYEYKFNIGLGWDGKDETTGNRTVDVGDADMTVEVLLFNNEEMPSGENATVTFNVDMEKYEGTGAFDPTANNVFVAGSFTGWQGGALLMADNGADTSVYTITVDTIASAQMIKFKFIWAPGDTVGDPAIEGTTWEGVADRELWVVDGEQTFSAFWNDEDPNAAGLADGNITFNIDMSVMSEIGIFDPNTDSVQIRGGFNGWSDSEPLKSKMNQDFLNPDAWFIEIPFVGAPIDGEQFHKYFVSFADTNVSNEWSDGYERPLSQGGGNRAVAFEGTPDQTADPVFYDGVLPNYMIEEEGIEITFSIDMTVAADAGQQVPTFNPETDTVWWISEQPAFVYSQGWEDTDDMRVLALTDEDADMVYEGTLTVMAPAWNGFEYRYGFSNTESFTKEEAGFGNFAYRVRYIEQDGYRSFVQPYAAPTDTWFLVENKESEWEAGPAGDITGVEQIDLVANKFSLEQNYPNPFNPTTQIRFSIPATDIVTLKIYNLLGQEIKILINEELKAGSYEFNFNASNFASGLYIYALSSGNFVSNKKMLLLK